jgi:chlorophyllide a reductase subunit Y
VQKGKEKGIPGALLHQPHFGASADGAGRCRLAPQVVNAAIGNKDRMDRMKAFFEGVGEGDTAGVWEGAPNRTPGIPRGQRRSRQEAAPQARKTPDRFRKIFQMILPQGEQAMLIHRS